MKRRTLELLACPTCHGELTLSEVRGNGVVEAGSLSCAHCQRAFPIEAGIPRFIKAEELAGLNRRFARLYDWFSYLYLPASQIAGFFGRFVGVSRHDLLKHLELGGGRVLEVAIGPGVNLPYMYELPGVQEVFGLDISLGQLQRCQSYCRKHGWAVDLFLGMAEALPFRDESFDSLLHFGGINFFSDKKKAIEEMIRVARPGTKIVIGDETEKVARAYEKILPGFSRSFEGKRETVVAPVDLVPKEMEEVRLSTLWRDAIYVLEFRKPR